MELFAKIANHFHLRCLKWPPEVFYEKKAVLKNLAIFTGEHLCWSLFLIKLQENILKNTPYVNTPLHAAILPTFKIQYSFFLFIAFFCHVINIFLLYTKH